MPPTSALFPLVGDGPPAGPGGGGKCAVEHESVVWKVPTGLSPYEMSGFVYERQRTQQSATERSATATKRVASLPMLQLNCHLISLDHIAVANECNWACLGVRQPWYHETESRTAKFYGVCLQFWSWRHHDGFLTKNRECVIVALAIAMSMSMTAYVLPWTALNKKNARNIEEELSVV